MAKVLIFCFDHISKSMAGPGIRSWEFAKILSKSHDVTLMIPNKTDVIPDGFSIVTTTSFINNKNLFKNIDVIITQLTPYKLALAAKLHGTKIILDAYDPMPLERLELFKSLPPSLYRSKIQHIVDYFNFSFQIADTVICANQSQKKLWTGLMLSQKKISTDTYIADQSLKNLIDIVPFGLSSTPPLRNGDGLKKMFNLKNSDKVVLWGGGIWNWFDPLTLIEAIHQISQQRSDIKLVFMGTKHPNEKVPEMKMTVDAHLLAKKLNLLDKHVFFNFGWVPYEQRASFLLDADIGVSTHHEHLETDYSFRTRMLDYLWAKLPIIGTEGDAFAEIIAKNEIGLVVPYGDSQTLAKAIVHIIDNPHVAEKMKENIEQVRQQFYWDIAVKPLERMISDLASTPRNKPKFKDFKNIFNYLCRAVRRRVFPFAVLKEFLAEKLGFKKS
jgi:glycosyltransferase involved in cell wall biosynthesis